MTGLPTGSRVETDEQIVLSEAEALAVWSRAARLQAEADLVEQRTVALNTPPSTDTVALAEGTRAPAGMYLVSEIVGAARDVGIADTFVRVALAEHDALGPDRAVVLEHVDEGMRDHHIGVNARSVRARRVIPESPQVVLQRLRAVAAAAPWSLEFERLVGDHPTRGGVLRFSVPVIGVPRDASALPRPLSRFVYHASRVGLLHVHVTVEPLGADTTSTCALTITGDLRSGEQRSIRIYRALTKGLAGVFAVAGAAVGWKAGGPAGAVLGAFIGGSAAVGYNSFVAAIGRWEHRLAHRALTAELDALVGRVQRPSDEARAFGPPEVVPAPRLTRSRDDVSLPLRTAYGLA